MQRPPLVSIIIPTHNDIPVLYDAVDCALNQTYGNREVIVVDDGSTDDTGRLLERKYEGRISYVYQKNRGPGSARNAGIRNASGQYLQFLDADDLINHDKISIQVRAMEGLSDRALSYCDYLCCDIDDMTVIYERRSPVLQNKRPVDDIMLRWETELTIPVHSFLFHAALFKENGITFDETLRANEDWECWMRIFMLDPQVVFVDRVLAYYRVRSDSRCRNRAKMRDSWVSAIDKQIRQNRLNREVVEKLHARKKEIRYAYRDAGLVTRMLQNHPVAKQIYWKVIPWRIQRMLD
jgi:glycosyltransferase involved in cell wall biosynthesis